MAKKTVVSPPPAAYSQRDSEQQRNGENRVALSRADRVDPRAAKARGEANENSEAGFDSRRDDRDLE
jgi:hypothetical protein